MVHAASSFFVPLSLDTFVHSSRRPLGNTYPTPSPLSCQACLEAEALSLRHHIVPQHCDIMNLLGEVRWHNGRGSAGPLQISSPVTSFSFIVPFYKDLRICNKRKSGSVLQDDLRLACLPRGYH